MSLDPGQVAVTSRSPTGGKSTLKELEPWALTLKLVVPRSVRTGEGVGVGVVTGVGADAGDFPPQLEMDARTAPVTRASGNGRIFIEQPPELGSGQARTDNGQCTAMELAAPTA